MEIQFIYEELATTEKSEVPSQIVPEEFAILPTIWLQEFQQALIEGRVREMEILVKEIPSQNKKLAATLLDFSLVMSLSIYSNLLKKQAISIKFKS